MRILLSGGGTGGHVNPAIAVADKIKAMEPDSEIAFVGTGKGIESKLVPKAGYKLYTYEVRGLKRSLSLDNIKRLFMAAAAVTHAGLLYARRREARFRPLCTSQTRYPVSRLKRLSTKLTESLSTSNLLYPNYRYRKKPKEWATRSAGFSNRKTEKPRAINWV